MTTPTLTATIHPAGFAHSHDSYNSMGVASDRCLYYVLSSEVLEKGGQMYRFSLTHGDVAHVADLTEVCGEVPLRAVPQGKSHVNFVEAGGALYFGTHVGYYTMVDGKESMPIAPEGWNGYPGGHFLRYDLGSGEVTSLGVLPNGEGILTLAMDVERMVLYALSWPSGSFFAFDVETRQVRGFGPVCEDGEAGDGPTFRTICRSMLVNPEDGSVYLTNSHGDLLRYRAGADVIERVHGDDLRKDYFGLYDPASPGHMGYNWRQAFWYAPQKRIYGVHGNSGYLFRFDPESERVEVLERLTSLPSKRSGMFDQFSYGYLGFTLGPDGETIYYLTGAPVYVDGRRVAGKASTAKGESKGMENLHLVTYHIPSETYRDHGAVLFEGGERPAYVNSIAVPGDGFVYALSRVPPEGLTELIRFPDPATVSTPTDRGVLSV